MVDTLFPHKSMATITTTIRWDAEELDDVKKAAKEVGLPVALYVKSEALKRARIQDQSALAKALVEAHEDLRGGRYDVFDSPKELLEDLRLHMKKK
jgi:hypothetical protein